MKSNPENSLTVFYQNSLQNKGERTMTKIMYGTELANKMRSDLKNEVEDLAKKYTTRLGCNYCWR